MNKKAYSLFELIIVLFISSLIIVFSFKFSNELYLSEEENYKTEIYKLDLNSTKIFFEKNIDEIPLNISYRNKTLYFHNNILLQNVSSFSIKSSSDYLNVDIEIDNKITQSWVIKK